MNEWLWSIISHTQFTMVVIGIGHKHRGARSLHLSSRVGQAVRPSWLLGVLVTYVLSIRVPTMHHATMLN